MRFKEVDRRKILTTTNSVQARGGHAFYPSPGGYQQSAAATTDGSVVFRIVSQPETQHRARYQTEGSRGAIKDRAGTGYPTVVLEGCRKQTRIQIFIGNESGKVVPHMFYQVCKVAGKNSHPCEEKTLDGTDVIEMAAKPHNDMRLICDCIGILKERYTDIEARFPEQTSWKNSKKKSTKCRMVFRAIVQNRSGQSETLQVVSDVINCSQLPGIPEITKMSSNSSPVEGGGELWMIGKNFLKDTHVVFSYSILNKEEPLWVKVAEPFQEFFHQSHLIVKIPAFFDASFHGDTVVSVFIKCGDKLSDSVPFTYKANPIKFTFGSSLPFDNPGLLNNTVKSPNEGNIRQSKYKSELVSVIKENHSVCKKARPTFLEPIEGRRARSVSGPSLVNENAILVSDTSKENHTMTTFPSTAFLVKETPKTFDHHKENLNNENIATNFKVDGQNLLRSGREEELLSFDEEANDSSFTRDSLLDENSFLSTKTDAIRNYNTDFSNTFDSNWNNKPTTSFNKQTDTCIDPVSVNSSNEVQNEESKKISSVSFEAAATEKAVISISLPASILKDQRHFQSVMDTINCALIKPDSDKTELTDDQEHELPANENEGFMDEIQKNKDINVIQSSEVAKQEEKSGLSASLLSTTRKRTFTGENVEASDCSGKDKSIEYINHVNSDQEWKSIQYDDDNTWKSGMDIFTPPDFSTKAVVEQQTANEANQLIVMDWSSERNIGLLEEKTDKDIPKPLASYLDDPISSEVTEALDIIENFQQNKNKMEEDTSLKEKTLDI